MKYDFLKLARLAAQAMDDKKALDIVLLNVRAQTAMTDYLLLCTVESTPQMSAVLDAVEMALKATGVTPLRRDSRNSRTWAVIDFGGLLVHAFMPEARELFALEKFWHGARKVKPLGPVQD